MGKTDHLYMPEDHMDSLYRSDNFIVRFVHNARIDSLVESIGKTKEKKILDAGCGEGHLLEILNRTNPDNQYYGFDVSKNALRRAQKRCAFADIKNMDLTDIKTKDGFFDIIICTEVLEHVPEYKQVIKEFSRVLKKGGLLLITFPNELLWTISRFLLGRRPIKVPDHVNSFTPKKMLKIVDMPVKGIHHIPLGLPFFLSLNALIIFKK